MTDISGIFSVWFIVSTVEPLILYTEMAAFFLQKNFVLC